MWQRKLIRREEDSGLSLQLESKKRVRACKRETISANKSDASIVPSLRLLIVESII
jgi:hypothetical protein